MTQSVLNGLHDDWDAADVPYRNSGSPSLAIRLLYSEHTLCRSTGPAELTADKSPETPIFTPISRTHVSQPAHAQSLHGCAVRAMTGMSRFWRVSSELRSCRFQ